MVTLRQMETHAGLDALIPAAPSRRRSKISWACSSATAPRSAEACGAAWASPTSSLAFLAMDSYVELHEGGIVPLERFVNMPYDKDILVRHYRQEAPRRVRVPGRAQAAHRPPHAQLHGGEARRRIPRDGGRSSRVVPCFCATTRASLPMASPRQAPQRSPSMPREASAFPGTCGAAPSTAAHLRPCSCAAPCLR